MALHEVEITESIIELEYDIYILRAVLDHIIEHLGSEALQGLDMVKLKREAARDVKKKFPDEDIRLGDWT